MAAAAPGSIALEGGDARVEVVPAHGGRVRAMRIGGRDWLLPADPRVGPDARSAPIAGAGWDECAPSAGGGALPEWVKGHSGQPAPLGGETRLQRPSIELRTTDEGHVLRCEWQGSSLPWRLTRTLIVRRDGVVEARYEALSSAAQRLPFLWSAHLLFPLTKETRLRLPDACRLRVSALGGTELSAPTELMTQWPRLTLGKKACDLSAPWSVPRATYLRSWADLSGGRATVQVQQGELSLGITMDGDGVPYCGVAIDRAGLRQGATGAFARRAAPALALAPSLGAPDRYAEALGEWQSVTWLAPHEPRRWSLTFRAMR